MPSTGQTERATDPLSERDFADADERSSAGLLRRRHQRLRMLAMVAVSYAVDTLLLFALHASGAIELSVPIAYAAIGAAVCMVFRWLLGSGWSERLADHYMVVPQMVISSAINLVFIAWAPQVGVLLMMVLFIVFAFGALRMSMRRVLVGAVLLSLVVGALLGYLGERLSLPMVGWQQRTLSGLWFGLILARTTILGLYGSQVRDVLARRNTQLAQTFAKLDELASRDELTGALNRRSIMRLIEEERARAKRSGHAFGVVMLDIDHFKNVNDRYGHLTGDEVLRRFALTVAQHMRTTDRLGRYGGEEFLMLLTEAGDTDAVTLAADRLRQAVARCEWSDLTPGLSLTVSAGASVGGRNDTTEQLLQRADEALYAAKSAGRNCVRLHAAGASAATGSVAKDFATA
jgi:diguanylate cyclase (GGDEF)-like protein